MPPATQLWLMRHGETEWSANGKHTSRTDVPLTDHGRQLAAELGTYLAQTTFTAALRSPMGRARETAEIAGFGNIAQVDENLREWDYGIFEGRTTKDIQSEIPNWSVWINEITGGETAEQVGTRADAVIAHALNIGAGGNVALFAHAHILRILAARWINLEARDGSLFALGTGSVSVLGWERDTRVINHWNRGFDDPAAS
jgi:broad specificity phosphatase PhoE